MTRFLDTSAQRVAIASRCFALWLNARGISAFRNLGLYLLMVSGVFATGTLAVAQSSSQPPASAPENRGQTGRSQSRWSVGNVGKGLPIFVPR
jgi:hypothetical protein